MPISHSEDDRVRMYTAFRQAFAQQHGVDRHKHTGEIQSKPGSSPKALPLLEWGCQMLPEYFTRAPSQMHLWISTWLERLAKRRGLKLNILGPRGSAKSTFVTLAYVLRCVLESREPYIWILSDTRQQVRSHLECIRTCLESNPEILSQYPEASGRGPSWRSQSLQLRNGTMIEAFGSGQRIRGKRSGANRPTLIICDDLQNDQHIYSAELRENSRNWFMGTVLKAGTDRTNVIHLGTALHRDGLSMQLTKTPGWRSKTFSSIVKWPNNMTLWSEWESIFSNTENPNAIREAENFYQKNRSQMLCGSQVLWPENESLYTLMRIRAEGGHAAFEREKQNRPIHPDQCEWPEELFDDTIWFDDFPIDLNIRILALDPSKGTNSGRGDYSAFVFVGIDENGIHYVDADLAKRSTTQIITDGVELYKRYKPDAFGVESNQFQQLLADAFTEEFRRQHLPSVHPWLIENRINKQIRIRRLSPLLSARKLRFRANSPGVRILVEQLQTFPIGDHDDGPDALEMAIRLSQEMFQS